MRHRSQTYSGDRPLRCGKSGCPISVPVVGHHTLRGAPTQQRTPEFANNQAKVHVERNTVVTAIYTKMECMYCLRHRSFKRKFACAGLRQYLQTQKRSAPAYPSTVFKRISEPVFEQVTSTRMYILAENPYSFSLLHLEKYSLFPYFTQEYLKMSSSVCFGGRVLYSFSSSVGFSYQ